ncbi:hypothetical protein BSZ36_10880 [Rubricoccus marinus]|uniref:non-specific protein-tyrosine kinase n=1 Tax=Rubricoccus marinus TaxID=716817 RepID=A0A259U0G8_9BACT|nr:hypothetical protein BSZ36_10880 [Rubricoccus marinus]
MANELYLLQYAQDLADDAARALLVEAETAGGELPITQTNDGDLAPVETVANRVGNAIRVDGAQDGVEGIQISAVSQSPVEAARVANLYADLYVARTQSSSRSSVSASRSFLKRQVDSVAVELRAREEATEAYMNREGAVRLDQEASNLVGQLSQLEAERDQARVEVGIRSNQIATLRNQIESLEQNVETRLRATADRELSESQARVASLRAQLNQEYLSNPEFRNGGADVPARVLNAQREVATLERRIEQLSGQIAREAMAAGGVDGNTSGLSRIANLRDQLGQAQVELSGLRERINILNSRISEYQGDLDQVPAQTVDLARLIRDRESTEQLLRNLTAKLQEVSVRESAELGYAEVLRPAPVPSTPAAPNRTRIMMLGLAIGLGLGVVLAVGRDQLDQRIRRPIDLRDMGYPVLGVIPSIDRLIEDDFGGAETVRVQDRDVDTRLVTLLVPVAQASEAFRGLRTSIQFSRPDTVIQTILVTSGSPGEGKTTMSSNLAAVMAQSGRRTLLVDCDLRRSRAHKLFGLNREPGLTDLLSRGANGPASGAAIGAVEVADDLFVLPAGSHVPNPSEHLGSLALRQQLDQFKKEFDIIILDAPPVMAATDAVLLSTQVDASMLVAAAGKTKDYELEFAVTELTNVGAHIIGVVLNRFDITKEYAYRAQYRYQYGKKYTYGASST